MFWLLLVVFFGNLAITTLPSYANFLQVRSIMDSIKEEQAADRTGLRAIKQRFDAQLYINGIRYPQAGDLQFKKVRDGVQMLLEYEVRKHLLFNIDLVMMFQHEVLLERP
jgi:hypothetical protein